MTESAAPLLPPESALMMSIATRAAGGLLELVALYRDVGGGDGQVV